MSFNESGRTLKSRFSSGRPIGRGFPAEAPTSLDRHIAECLSNEAGHSPKHGLRPSQNTRRARTQGSQKLWRYTFKNPLRSKICIFRQKSFRTAGTIARAIPPWTTCATAPLIQQLRIVSVPSVRSKVNRMSQRSEGAAGTPTIRSAAHTRRRSKTMNATPDVGAGTPARSPSNASRLTGRMRDNDHTRTQRNATEGRSREPPRAKSSISQFPYSQRTSRPQVQVIIPSRPDTGKPLPSRPIPKSSDTGRASEEIEIMYSVSPPSEGNDSALRGSVVSPLNIQQLHKLQSANPKITVRLADSLLRSPELNGANTSSDDSREDDRCSTHSDRSSLTSNEPESPTQSRTSQSHRTTVSEAFLVKPLVTTAEVRDSHPCQASKSDGAETGQCLVPTPPRMRKYAPHPPVDADTEFMPSCSLRPLRDAPNTLHQHPSTTHKLFNTYPDSSTSMPQLGAIYQILNSAAAMQCSSCFTSPTLSEAENELERHLTAFTDDNPFQWDDVVIRQDSPLSPQGMPRKDSITFPFTPHSLVPSVPRKSSKRQTRMGLDGFRMSRVPTDHIASQWKRKSSRTAKGLSIAIPEMEFITSDDFELSPLPIPPRNVKRAITPEVAENVLLSILQTLESLDDLFACAVVNRGFYRVFKRYELDLMKGALRKMSPPAWELRELCYPGHDQLGEDLDRPREEYTPISYICHYSRDMYTIAALKTLIKEQCQSFLRPEISVAIVSEDPQEAARVDDALWRIWTFCKLFGSGKGREEDLVAQMDWLKGGELVHQQTCGFVALTWDDMNETLASAPECFAKGNEGGMSAEQLFDMMELWNCLGVLLQPIEGRTIQAREFGLYDKTDIRGGDIDGEEMMLDEWYYYLLTLGPVTTLELAETCHDSAPTVFNVASEQGLLSWTPPVLGGTRRNFLKEPASRIYEEKITLRYAESSAKEVQRALSKQRIQRHINELRHRKASGEPLHEIRMSQDRPMSEWEGVMQNLTRPRPSISSNNLVSHIPSLRGSGGFPAAVYKKHSTAASELSAARTPPVSGRIDSPPRRMVAQPLLPTPPPSTAPSTRDRSSMASSMLPIEEHPNPKRQDVVPEMPRLEEHPMFTQHLRQRSDESQNSNGMARSMPSTDDRAVFQQQSFQHAMHRNGNANDTAGRAIHRIVEMGFTPEQARQALRRTDMGSGLRVDRAVELLLREMSF